MRFVKIVFGLVFVFLGGILSLGMIKITIEGEYLFGIFFTILFLSVLYLGIRLIISGIKSNEKKELKTKTVSTEEKNISELKQSESSTTTLSISKEIDEDTNSQLQTTKANIVQKPKVEDIPKSLMLLLDENKLIGLPKEIITKIDNSLSVIKDKYFLSIESTKNLLESNKIKFSDDLSTLSIENDTGLLLDIVHVFENRTIQNNINTLDKQEYVPDENVEDLWGRKIPIDFKKSHLEWYRSGSSNKIICTNCEKSGKVICPKCGGKGKYSQKCDKCKGTGEIVRKDKMIGGNTNKLGGGIIIREEQCLKCQGTGSVIITCSSCNGTGQIKCKTCHGHGELISYENICSTIKNISKSVYIKTSERIDNSLFKKHIDDLIIVGKDEIFDQYSNYFDFVEKYNEYGKLTSRIYQIKFISLSHIYYRYKNRKRELEVINGLSKKKLFGLFN